MILEEVNRFKPSEITIYKIITLCKEEDWMKCEVISSHSYRVGGLIYCVVSAHTEHKNSSHLTYYNDMQNVLYAR